MKQADHSVDQLGIRIEEMAGTDTSTTGRRERIDIVKTAMREVWKEWLDDQVREFGKWSLRVIVLAGLAALLYFILTHSGWKRTP